MKITVGQYQDYLKKENPDADDMIILTGQNPKEITAKEYEETIEKVSEFFKTKHPIVLKYKGLGFIPDLRYSNITAGELFDMTSYVDNPEMFHRFLQVCYRPIKKDAFSWMPFQKRYNIEEYNGTDEEFDELYKSLPVELLLSSRLFFWKLRNDLTRYTLKSMKNKLDKLQENEPHNNNLKKPKSERELKSFHRNIITLQSSIRSLEVALKKSTTLPESQLSKFCIFTDTKKRNQN